MLCEWLAKIVYNFADFVQQLLRDIQRSKFGGFIVLSSPTSTFSLILQGFNIGQERHQQIRTRDIGRCATEQGYNYLLWDWGVGRGRHICPRSSSPGRSTSWCPRTAWWSWASGSWSSPAPPASASPTEHHRWLGAKWAQARVGSFPVSENKQPFLYSVNKINLKRYRQRLRNLSLKILQTNIKLELTLNSTPIKWTKLSNNN